MTLLSIVAGTRSDEAETIEVSLDGWTAIRLPQWEVNEYEFVSPPEQQHFQALAPFQVPVSSQAIGKAVVQVFDRFPA